MKIIISGKGMDITDGIREAIEKKLGKLDKYLPEDVTAKAVVSSRKKGQDIKVEVTIPLKKHLLRAEESDKDLNRAVDKVQEVLERQIRKYKTKILSKKREESIKTMEPQVPEADEAADAIRIVRDKKVVLEPMGAEEACMRMDLLGHNFFMFLNADTDKVCVVYKRYDDAYGMIEPE